MNGRGSFGTATLLVREDDNLTHRSYSTQLLNLVTQLNYLTHLTYYSDLVKYAHTRINSASLESESFVRVKAVN
jgi:hypothetical protein